MRLNLHKLDQDDRPHRKTNRYPLLRLKQKRSLPAKNSGRAGETRPRSGPPTSTE